MSHCGQNAFVAMVMVALGAGATASVIVNFDEYPGGAPVLPGDTLTTQWSALGVEFSNGQGGGPGPSGNACSVSAPNHAFANQIVAIFVDPCTGAPSVTDFAGSRQDFCWVPGEGIDMYWYDANGVELHHEFNAGGGALLTFSTPQPVIARLDMYCVLQGIDDFTFNTPQPVLRGDMDCSDTLEVGDVEPFVLALIDPDQYAALFPACHVRRADMNCDRLINGLDIDPFVVALLAP